MKTRSITFSLGFIGSFTILAVFLSSCGTDENTQTLLGANPSVPSTNSADTTLATSSVPTSTITTTTTTGATTIASATNPANLITGNSTSVVTSTSVISSLSTTSQTNSSLLSAASPTQTQNVIVNLADYPVILNQYNLSGGYYNRSDLNTGSLALATTLHLSSGSKITCGQHFCWYPNSEAGNLNGTREFSFNLPTIDSANGKNTWLILECKAYAAQANPTTDPNSYHTSTISMPCPIELSKSSEGRLAGGIIYDFSFKGIDHTSKGTSFFKIPSTFKKFAGSDVSVDLVFTATVQQPEGTSAAPIASIKTINSVQTFIAAVLHLELLRD